MKLTTTTVRALTLPPGVSERTFFDDSLPGFGVRVRRSGAKTFVVQYKHAGKNRRIAIGTVEALDFGKARATAKDLLARVRLGEDPAGARLEQRQRPVYTFASLLPRFLTRQAARLKPRSLVESRRHLEVHCRPLHTRAVDTIDRRDSAVLLGDIADKSGPSAANSVHGTLSAYSKWLLYEGLIETSFTLHINRAVENAPRSRLLTDTELVAIWRALEDAGQYAAVMRLLLLCGSRRDEIANLKWSETDLERALITLAPARTKGRLLHEIPLSTQALAILQAQPRRIEPDGTPRDLVFGYGTGGWQAWSRSKADLDAGLAASGTPVAGWVTHDFRRAISTALHERFGTAPHVVESILGHRIGGIAATYNLSSYRDLKRVALQKWGDHLETLVTGKPASTVVALKR